MVIAIGHFGRDEPGFTWERTDKAARLREQAGLAAATPAAGNAVP
jgi:S-adenosylmethionine synthetase